MQTNREEVLKKLVQQSVNKIKIFVYNANFSSTSFDGKLVINRVEDKIEIKSGFMEDTILTEIDRTLIRDLEEKLVRQLVNERIICIIDFADCRMTEFRIIKS
jgi:hypothetical protein